ncbi:NTPase [Amycolatopsis sp. NBRC 101858]|uniref:KAP family P-loop NTPase fold protein n=1 Tax=Amycolatopsis sp. NBRC 101858 TaxID=3032200 RepID=UPI0024A29133|nr:KAP family NTPase [Amycolatopsis sp. NBRC 101858]GLY39620.1 NTPase [Amycolatopsis sp. NBRC 101858]
MATTGDNPIKEPAEDTLGRASLARHLAVELRHLDASEGSVFAVMGPWGSGKTSLINMIRRNLGDDPPITVLDFNPWMFSGTEQLVDSFFAELAAQLGEKPGKLGKIASELDAYGELLSPLGAVPFVGTWITRFGSGAKALKKFEDRRKQSVTQRRAELSSKLAELEQPFVVVIDDIDRLDSSEVRDIFKLVRLTASFPNAIYLLAFDRDRVEQALTGDGLTGRNYLEKIVQASVDIPAVSDNLLISQLTTALDAAIGDVSNDVRFDQSRWPDVLMEIVHPLVQNMRDVRRFAASVRGTLRSLEDAIEVVDILAIEAVRVFAPDLFRSVVSNRVALTTTASLYVGSRPNEAHKAAINEVLSSSPGHEKIAENLIRRVLSAGSQHLPQGMHYGPDFQKQWLKGRRLAHPHILGLYLERLVGDDLLAFNDAERAFAVLADAGQLAAIFAELDPARREDVISALETFEGDYPVEAVVPASAVLLNVLPTLPKRERGMFSMGDSRLTVTRVVLRLFREIERSAEVEEAVKGILPHVEILSSKLDLIHMVGHREGVGHKLASEDGSKIFEEVLSGQVQQAVAADLRKDPGLLRLMLWMRERPDREQGAISVLLDDPTINLAVLLQAYGEARIQAIDSRAVTREPRLGWEALERIYGSEDAIREAIESAQTVAGDSEPAAEVLTVARKYLEGWRPERF